MHYRTQSVGHFSAEKRASRCARVVRGTAQYQPRHRKQHILILGTLPRLYFDGIHLAIKFKRTTTDFSTLIKTTKMEHTQ